MALYQRPPRSDELYHHGILGQKWGVRRYQPYPPGKHGKFLDQSRDEDIRIKKGSSAYRVQEGTKLEGSGQKYVSFDKLDSLTYVAATVDGHGLNIQCHDFSEGNMKAKDGAMNIITMKLDKDIVAPSYNKTMESFINTVNTIGVKNVAKDLSKFEVNGETRYSRAEAQEFIKKYKAKKSQDCLDEAYLQFASTMMKDTETKKAFFNDLKRQGYNAIVDDNDSNFGRGMTRSPVIMFDSSNVRQTKSERVSAKEIEYNYDRLNNTVDSEEDKKYLRNKYGSKIHNKYDNSYYYKSSNS